MSGRVSEARSAAGGTRSTPRPSGALLCVPRDAGNGTVPLTATEARAEYGDRVIVCGAGHWWTGRGREHCTGCGRTFSGTTSGDMHRRGAHGVDRHCADPATVGLVARPQPGGWVLWGQPGPDSTTVAELRGGISKQEGSS